MRWAVADRMLWLAVAGGVALRLFHYVHCRSMWFDEACLALNILHRSFGELLQPALSFHQAAPLGFLWMEKVMELLVGEGELSLRLPLVLGGILALIVFAHIVRKILTREGALVSVFLFGVSWPIVRFATEVKPYGVDVLVAIGIWWMVLRMEHSPIGLRRAAAFGCVGAVAVWCSYPSILVLASAAGVLVWRAARYARRDAVRAAVVVVGLWMLSGCLAYASVLRELGENPYFEQFWSATFMPTPPWSVDWIRWVLDSGAAILRSTIGLPMSLPAGVAVCVGTVSFLRRRVDTALFLLAPLLIAAVASAFDWYPFTGRFLLFAAPAVFVLIGEGASRLLRAGSTRFAALVGSLLVAALVAQPLWIAAERIVHPQAPQEVKPLLAHLQRNVRPSHVVIVDRALSCSYLYYRRQFEIDDVRYRIVYAPPPGRTVNRMLADLAASPPGVDGVWVVLSDLGPLKPSAVGRRLTAGDGASYIRRSVIRERGAVVFWYVRTSVSDP